MLRSGTNTHQTGSRSLDPQDGSPVHDLCTGHTFRLRLDRLFLVVTWPEQPTLYVVKQKETVEAVLQERLVTG